MISKFMKNLSLISDIVTIKKDGDSYRIMLQDISSCSHTNATFHKDDFQNFSFVDTLNIDTKLLKRAIKTDTFILFKEKDVAIIEDSTKSTIRLIEEEKWFDKSWGEDVKRHRINISSIKELIKGWDAVEFKITDNKLTINCQDKLVSEKLTLIAEDEDKRSLFSTAMLNQGLSLMSFDSDVVDIAFETDTPIILEQRHGKSRIKFTLAPRISND